MNHPTKNEITERLQSFLNGELSRNEIYEWAYSYVKDDNYEVEDTEAWNYLLDVLLIDEMIYPNKYFYSREDIEELLKKYE